VRQTRLVWLRRTRSVRRAGSHAERRNQGERERCFDLDLIVIAELHAQQVVYLREVGGDRKIPILTGIFEATALDRKVKGYESPRPLTHDATAMIIRALGAEVQDVVVDAVEQHTYYAKVRIRQGSRVLAVDLRPSDAFMLAVAFDRPIFFTKEVLDKLE
jgi:bifunctional DNase/RNase